MFAITCHSQCHVGLLTHSLTSLSDPFRQIDENNIERWLIKGMERISEYYPVSATGTVQHVRSQRCVVAFRTGAG